MDKQEVVTMEKQGPIRRKNSKCLLILLLGIAPLLMGGLCSQSGPVISSHSVGNNGTSNTQILSDQAFSQLQMLSPTIGWATTAKAVLKTSDAGKTWTDVTPADWEPAEKQNTGTNPIMGILSAAFLDPSNAWVAAATQFNKDNLNAAQSAIPSSVSNTNGTVTVDPGKIPSIGSTVYVRSTNDGGRTWITSNPISTQNLTGVSQLNFINEHEGWLEVMQSTSDGTSKGDVYHTVDGGITWNLAPTPAQAGQLGGPIYCSSVCTTSPIPWNDGTIPSSAITSQSSLTGLTVAPNCVQPGENVVLAAGNNLSSCPTYASSSVRGCVATPTEQYTGWGTGIKMGSSSTFLMRGVSENSGWRSIPGIAAPSRASSDQSQNLDIISNPPVVFPNRDSILPIQLLSDPSGNGNAQLFLHLYRLTLTSSSGIYNLSDYSPTTSFAVPMIWQQHSLSALDSGRVFVIGQEYSNGTAGNWNLHEFNGQSWISLTNKADATIKSLQSVLTAGLSNLDFISDTEGWVTDGPILYHLTVANDVVNWSQVYPNPTIKTTSSNSAGSVQIVQFARTPGEVVNPPQNPPACDAINPTPPVTPPGSAGGPSDAKTHTITFVNTTDKTIWVGESGDRQPVPGWNGELTPGSKNSLTIKTPNAELSSVRFWGRTNCVNGKCETGDCGPAVLCGGSSGATPATLAEFAFNGSGGQVFYDVSLVDGYNLPMLITSSGGPAPDNCGAKPCVDLNQTCPSPLQVVNGSGQVIACNSACNAFHTDQYCCLGQYGPGVCNPNTWPPDRNSAKFFKDAYPHAYSFAYNDDTSTYTCNETCDLTVYFGTTT